MSVSVDPTLRNLNECSCCEGLSAQTPMQVFNRPGLSAIAYRVGTHTQFKHTLLARLSGSGQSALRGLNTRDDDDFSITLLDAWATVADVLTFYQERIANESYLRTATERLSVLELARLIGYELRPGVAASTYIAFTIEDTPGALGRVLSLDTTAQSTPEEQPQVTIDLGTKVQSVPGPGEQAQTFETVESISTRAEWNAIRPRLTRPQQLVASMASVVLQGDALNLKQGDALLLSSENGNRVVKTALNVTVDTDAKTTRVDFASPALSPATYSRPTNLSPGNTEDFPTKVGLDDTVVAQIIARTWSAEDLSALAVVQGWSAEALTASIEKYTSRRTLPANVGAFVFRQRAAIFGHNAPKEPAYTARGIPLPMSKWEEWDLESDETSNQLFLDTAYEGIVVGGFLSIQRPKEQATIFLISEVILHSRNAYGLSAKTTVVKLAGGQSWWNPEPKGKDDFSVVRGSTILARSEQLVLADVPIEDVISGDALALDGVYLGLRVGQNVILSGERQDLAGIVTNELRTLKEVLVEAGFTVLTFTQPLTYSYRRRTVVVNANVALCTHGESVQEVLGNGDASQAFQAFTLRQPPLTHVSAATASGTQSTLSVRVNDLLWQEVSTLYGRGPDERVYIARTADDGKTTVMIGDGKTGARLPTGQTNVKASYRKGIGLPGLVKAGQLTQLITRPLGVKGGTNPFAASGAADPENLIDARRNAPLTVLTLDRIVSLQDYEDFARAFAGIGKALATWTWNGEKRGVFVTVAGTDGAEVTRESPLYSNLLAAMRQAGDPAVPLQVQSYSARFFQLAAALQVQPEYIPEAVVTAVEQHLREQFAFTARNFAQPVHLSEVIAVMQNVPGVVAVDVDQFFRSDGTPGDKPEPRLPASIPRLDGNQLIAAELLLIDARSMALEVRP